jgi:hypothetical protein
MDWPGKKRHVRQECFNSANGRYHSLCWKGPEMARQRQGLNDLSLGQSRTLMLIGIAQLGIGYSESITSGRRNPGLIRSKTLKNH